MTFGASSQTGNDANYGTTVDGDWGTKTSSAMQKFLGVEVDGIRGPLTVKAWQKWCNSQL